MPLTLIELLNDHWPLGDSVMSCKAAGGLQAVSVFVSTITITVIALDRYQLIIYPTKDVLERIGAVAGIIFIWVMGFCLASPIFVFRTLEHFDLGYHRKGNESDAEDQFRNPGKSVHSIDYWYVIPSFFYIFFSRQFGRGISINKKYDLKSTFQVSFVQI